MFAAGNSIPLGGMGFFVGIVGAAFMLVFAVVAALAGYGVWTFREWGRILCIVLAGISILFSLPGLLFMGLHFGFFLGGYRLIKLAISVAHHLVSLAAADQCLFSDRGAPALPRI